MNTDTVSTRKEPAQDDRILWDIIMGIYGYQAVLVAHNLGLFDLLAKKPLALAGVCDEVQIAPRPAEALLTVCRTLGLLSLDDGRYALTPLARDYLVPGSPFYFGAFFDLSLERGVLSFDTIRKAVLTDRPQVYGGEDLYAAHEAGAERARAFTRMMHSHSAAPARAWPEKLDLSAHRVMLDAGGGSGAHSISAATRWPGLAPIVFDLPPVCEVASEYIANAGLSHRIRTQAGDLWKDPFPPADLHFYSEIFHDFTPERCRFLAQKSYAGLPPGGRIILHEMLFDDGKAGPFAVAGFNVSMLLWTEGQQFSARELASMLEETGFADIRAVPTFGYWQIVTGVKP